MKLPSELQLQRCFSQADWFWSVLDLCVQNQLIRPLNKYNVLLKKSLNKCVRIINHYCVLLSCVLHQEIMLMFKNVSISRPPLMDVAESLVVKIYIILIISSFYNQTFRYFFLSYYVFVCVLLVKLTEQVLLCGCPGAVSCPGEAQVFEHSLMLSLIMKNRQSELLCGCSWTEFYFLQSTIITIVPEILFCRQIADSNWANDWCCTWPVFSFFLKKVLKKYLKKFHLK